MTKWEDTGKESFGYHGPDMFPSKIVCVFSRDGSQDVMALVHSTSSFDEEASSCLCEIWKQDYQRGARGQLHPVIHEIDVRCIDERVFVVEEAPGVREDLSPDRFEDRIPRVTLVKDRAEWPHEFTGYLQEDHVCGES
jgi:hypothetical protein